MLVVLSTGVQGCGPGKEEDETNPAVEACEDVRDVLITRALECAEEIGESYTREELEEDFSSSLDCDDALEIRDEDEFYDECLPAVEVLACSDLISGIFPSSCEGQILY